MEQSDKYVSLNLLDLNKQIFLQSQLNSLDASLAMQVGDSIA